MCESFTGSQNSGNPAVRSARKLWHMFAGDHVLPWQRTPWTPTVFLATCTAATLADAHPCCPTSAGLFSVLNPQEACGMTASQPPHSAGRAVTTEQVPLPVLLSCLLFMPGCFAQAMTWIVSGPGSCQRRCRVPKREVVIVKGRLSSD